MPISSSVFPAVRIAAFALVAALVASCASLGPGATLPPSTERAQSLESQGQPGEAARIYEALALDNSGSVANDFKLKAARAWLAARRPDEAARVLAGVGGTPSAAQAFEIRMLDIEGQVARGDAQRAWSALSAVPQPPAGPEAARYLAVKERVAFATGRPVDAVRAQIAREPLEAAASQRTSRSNLLTELRDAVERGVKLEPQATRDALVRGWLELGPIAANAERVPMSLAPALQTWRARYPNHPANDIVRSDLEQRGGTSAVASVDHVALLLPISGRQSGAASYVRDGFMTAYFQSPVATRPRVRVYDTSIENVASVVARAVAEGAQTIVGPLLREEVIAAASMTSPGVPVLALNYLPAEQAAPQSFYQFALSPENEARLIARRLANEGRLRGVALVPNGEWGTRVLGAFQEELRAAGGDVVASATFVNGSSDFSAPITQVLRLNDSKARHRRLEETLGAKVAFEPRRRGDAQFIFAPAPANTARQLRPQLRFFYAGDLPTYSTSDAYEPHGSANVDLDGLIFPDMPWALSGDGHTAEVRNAVVAAWGDVGPRRAKVFAFGYDAYQLIDAVRGTRPATSPIDGLTGRLTLDTERRVRRELEWAQIRNGQAVLLNPASTGATTQQPASESSVISNTPSR